MDVEPKPLKWLWRGRIPFGAVTIVDGDPGEGKSLILADIAARLSTGRALHGEDTPPCPAADVVVVNAEDDTATTTRPRYEVAGADLARIHVIDDGAAPFALDAEGRKLLEALIETRGAKLATIDPLMNYLPDDVDSNSDPEVRRVLRPLNAIAQRTGAAIVLARHLTKAFAGSAKKRGAGSMGIIAAARSGLIIHNVNGELRELRQSKPNLAGVVPSLRYRIEDKNGFGVVIWGDEPARGGADETEDPRDVVIRKRIIPALLKTPGGFRTMTEARNAARGKSGNFKPAWERAIERGFVVHDGERYLLSGSLVPAPADA
jgi:hypothetical protein